MIDDITLLMSGDEHAAVTAGEALDVRGWIVPPDAQAEIAIDGAARYPLAVGDPRPDVVAALRDSSAQFAGYRAVVPTSDLENGTHEVSLRMRNGAGGAVLAARSIEIRVARVGEGVAVEGYADQYVDEAGNAQRIDGDTVTVNANEVITIRGWAADVILRKPARGAVAFVGKHVVPAVYGSERIDVIPAVGDETLRFCGFAATFPGSYVDPGGTPFTVSLLAGDGRGFVPTSIALVMRAR